MKKKTTLFCCVAFIFFSSAALAEPISFATLGDSLTVGYSGRIHLAVENTGLDVDVDLTVCALGGLRTTQLLGMAPVGTPPTYNDYVADAIAADADFVFLMIGTNDVYWDVYRDANATVQYIIYKSNVTLILDRLTSPDNHPQVILSTLIPIVRDGCETANQRIDEWYNPWLRGLTQSYDITLLDLNQEIQQIDDWELLYNDGIHLWADGAAGYRWMAQRWIDTAILPDPGDANGDGVVDEQDASILATHWGTHDCLWGMGDFDGDGLVGPADASIMAANWDYNIESTASIPEPGTIVLLIGMVVSAGCLRRIG